MLDRLLLLLLLERITREKKRRTSFLQHVLLSNLPDKSCIAGCIGASTTDFFPDESIQNTLIVGDEVNGRPSYWFSRGHENHGFPEFLLYKLCSDTCLIDEIMIQPFRGLCHCIY